MLPDTALLDLKPFTQGAIAQLDMMDRVLALTPLVRAAPAIAGPHPTSCSLAGWPAVLGRRGWCLKAGPPRAVIWVGPRLHSPGTCGTGR